MYWRSSWYLHGCTLTLTLSPHLNPNRNPNSQTLTMNPKPGAMNFSGSTENQVQLLSITSMYYIQYPSDQYPTQIPCKSQIKNLNLIGAIRCCHVMHKLLCPSIRVRTAHPVSVRDTVRVSASFSYGIMLLHILFFNLGPPFLGLPNFLPH